MRDTLVGALLKGTMVGSWLGITEPAASPENADPPAGGSRKRAGHPLVNLHVILLRDEVRSRPKFRERNPDRRSDMPCVYVGQTSRDPEERFEHHMAGGKLSAPIVRNHGVRPLPDLYKDLNPVPATEREEQEERLALDLQEQGYGAWWN